MGVLYVDRCKEKKHKKKEFWFYNVRFRSYWPHFIVVVVAVWNTTFMYSTSNIYITVYLPIFSINSDWNSFEPFNVICTDIYWSISFLSVFWQNFFIAIWYIKSVIALQYMRLSAEFVRLTEGYTLDIPIKYNTTQQITDKKRFVFLFF